MSQRSRQSAVVLILLLLAGIFVWGCGANTKDSVTSVSLVPRDTTATTAPAGPGSAGLIGKQLQTTPDTPSEYVDAVKQGKPVVVCFYVAAGVEDKKVLESLNKLQGEFSDYAFLLYDCDQPAAYGDLSTLLKVDYPPCVILVDKTGTISAVWSGYVDEGTLNQSLVDVGGAGEAAAADPGTTGPGYPPAGDQQAGDSAAIQ